MENYNDIIYLYNRLVYKMCRMMISNYMRATTPMLIELGEIRTIVDFMLAYDYISTDYARFVRDVCMKMCGVQYEDYKDDDNHQQDENSNSNQDVTNETENDDMKEEISNGQQTENEHMFPNLRKEPLDKTIYEWLLTQGEHDDFKTVKLEDERSYVTIHRGQVLVSGKELAKKFNLSTTTAYNMLKKLAASGYIDRNTTTAKKTIVTILDPDRAYDGLENK